MLTEVANSDETNQIYLATSFIYLSTIGIVVLFFIYFKYERFRSYGFQLVLMICFGDFLFCLFNLISYMLKFTMKDYNIGKVPGFCVLDGMIAVFSEQAIFLNAGLMIYILYQIIYKERKIGEDSPIKYGMITYIYPLVCSFIPFFFAEPDQAYKSNTHGVSCYMPYKGWGMYLNAVVFIIPFLAVLGFEVVVLFLIFKKHYKKFIQEQIKKERNFLIIYPTILVICWIQLIYTDIASDLKFYIEKTWNTYVSKLCFLDGFLNAVVLSFQLYKRSNEMVENRSQISSEYDQKEDERGLLSNNAIYKKGSVGGSIRQDDSLIDNEIQ